MKTKVKEIRTKADVSLACPQCGAECRPEDVTKLQRRKLKSPAGDVLVLPEHRLELHCGDCGFDLWLRLDDAGKPIPYN